MIQTILANLRHALREQYGLIGLPPPTRVPHVGKIEPLVSNPLQPCEAGLERGRERIRPWTDVGSAEREVVATPPRIHADEIVEPMVPGHRSDVLLPPFG